VAKASDTNKMGFSGLAIVFGPTLMRSEGSIYAAMMNMGMQNATIEIILSQYEWIFDEHETLVEVNGGMAATGALPAAAPPIGVASVKDELNRELSSIQSNLDEVYRVGTQEESGDHGSSELPSDEADEVSAVHGKDELMTASGNVGNGQSQTT
jgi:hypothetical protein